MVEGTIGFKFNLRTCVELGQLFIRFTVVRSNIFIMIVLQSIIQKIIQLWNRFFGKKPKDRKFENVHSYPDAAAAARAFLSSSEKLFHVDAWSDLKGLASTFELYDGSGKRSPGRALQRGDFIKIILPGMDMENWVQVTDINEDPFMAEFTVHPSSSPYATESKKEPVEHFFIRESSSTFRVFVNETLLTASETGKNEEINNEGYEAGERKVLNTLIAAGGWAGVQKLQWEKLTRWLVHLEPDKHGA